MTVKLTFLPTPRQVEYLDGAYHLLPDRYILLEGGEPGRMRSIAARFQTALRKTVDLSWPIVASTATPGNAVGLRLKLSETAEIPPQGYRLSISPEGISVEAAGEPGLFYGVSTLIQIMEQAAYLLPCLQIVDWPDFPVRGVMLDVSRDKVPTQETLYQLIDRLSSWKINHLQLYMEHTFAYLRHPEVWAKASPLTGQEILELDAYCKERYIELAPNQNSFGHLHRWLEHPRYASLAEVWAGFEAPWGTFEGPFSLCPTDPRSLDLVRSLYDELLPHFSSRTVNVGCDETFDLGQGRSKEVCEKRGAGKVYLDYLLQIYYDLKSRGYTMQFWGDIIQQYPELIPELPRDLVALEWGYEANHPFDENCSRYAEAGIPFYVCPGTSSWASIAGRSDNALANLLNAAEAGRKHGAAGYLNTDWGDYGHWQPLPISFLGFAAGAAYSWGLAANRDLDLPTVLDQFAFRDPAGVMGKLVYQLGNIYQSLGIEWLNASALFSILQRPFSQLRDHWKIRSINYPEVLAQIDRVSAPLGKAEMTCPDANLVSREMALVVKLLKHACQRGMLAVGGVAPQDEDEVRENLDQEMLDIISNYQEIWLARNRDGGLEDSIARLQKIRSDYRIGESGGEKPAQTESSR